MIKAVCDKSGNTGTEINIARTDPDGYYVARNPECQLRRMLNTMPIKAFQTI
jgi:hypothetical protein